MTSPEILQWVTALGAIATPVILTLLTAVGWSIQRRVEKNQKIESELRERAHKLEEELRSDRLEVYNAILEPFIILFVKEQGFAQEKRYRGKSQTEVALTIVNSIEYRQAGFKLSLFGSDSVVRAYNDLLQFFYSHNDEQKQTDEKASTPSPVKVMEYFGRLLLEIRKNVGNEATSLHNLEMLEWMLTDARKWNASLTEQHQS
jgi:hypothetical protein